MRAFVSARFSDEALDLMRPYFDEIRLGGFPVLGFRKTGVKLSEEELEQNSAGCEVVIVEYDSVTERLFRRPGLRLVGCARNEPEASVDIEAATRHGIPVIYPPGRNAVTVAEHAFGLMLAVARHIGETDHLLKYSEQLTAVNYAPGSGSERTITSEWSLADGAPFWRFSGPELHGKTLSLIGFGAIGEAMVRIARGFAMEILVYDPYVAPTRVEAVGGHYITLDHLLARADFISVHCKVTEETKGLIGFREFGKMKTTAYFVNTARAAIVVTDALVEALRERRIAGAGIDVYDREPMDPDHPLRSCPNVVLTPHIAAASPDIPRRHSMMLAQDVLRFLHGERPKFVVNPQVLD